MPEQQRHARRQRRRRDQHRPQQQEGKRILQAAGKVEKRREFGDVEAEQIRGPLRLEPPGLRKTDLQRDVEERRQPDHRQAGQDRNVKLEAEMHDQDGHGLAEDGKPAQPYQRVEPYVPRPVGCPCQTKHAANVTTVESLSK